MAQSPVYKVYARGKYIASCKYLEDAATLVASNGGGTKIRYGHNGAILWHEGKEEFEAGESFDRVAEVAGQRQRNMR